jgi:hypothetical protein
MSVGGSSRTDVTCFEEIQEHDDVCWKSGSVQSHGTREEE